MEIIAMLTAAKEMGFEAGQMVATLIVYLLLDRSFSKRFGELIKAIKDLEATHNKRIETIETHVGLKK